MTSEMTRKSITFPDYAKKGEMRRTINPVLRTMDVGQTESWPLIQLNAVRSSAVTIGTQFEKKYSTHVNRENGTVEVTRIA